MRDEDFDIVGVVREIRAVARKRRGSGEVSDDLERSVEESFRQFAPPEPKHESVPIREALAKAEAESVIDPRVPTDSRRSYLVPVKRGIRAAVSWYFDVIVTRVEGALRANRQAVDVTGEVVESIEDRVEELEAQVAKLQRRLDAERTR